MAKMVAEHVGKMIENHKKEDIELEIINGISELFRSTNGTPLRTEEMLDTLGVI